MRNEQLLSCVCLIVVSLLFLVILWPPKNVIKKNLNIILIEGIEEFTDFAKDDSRSDICVAKNPFFLFKSSLKCIH